MTSEPNFIPDKLQHQYQESIPEKINTLKQLISQFQNIQDLDSLTSLRNAVHKIAGSAGTYGYSEVSKICKEFEGDLIQKIKDFSNGAHSDWLTDFENYIIKIEEGFIHANKQK